MAYRGFISYSHAADGKHRRFSLLCSRSPSPGTSFMQCASSGTRRPWGDDPQVVAVHRGGPRDSEYFLLLASNEDGPAPLSIVARSGDASQSGRIDSRGRFLRVRLLDNRRRTRHSHRTGFKPASPDSDPHGRTRHDDYRHRSTANEYPGEHRMVAVLTIGSVLAPRCSLTDHRNSFAHPDAARRQ